METLESARAFLYRNARPLDMARFRYHFENGSREDVLYVLSSYQNADGGFGHALEADCWNPYSSPIQTWAATEIVREVQLEDSKHPLIQSILRYLGSGKDFNGAVWGNVVPENNNYPHAPWWSMQGDSLCHYNPTACLAGFLIRFAKKDSENYQLGCRISREAVTWLSENGESCDMHMLTCFIRLLEYAKAANADCIDTTALENCLRPMVKAAITCDKTAWAHGYVCKPSQFLSGEDSPFYADNREIAQYECEFIRNTQSEDGAWQIPWSWTDYPEQWAISKNWWKGCVALTNLLYLKGFNEL